MEPGPRRLAGGGGAWLISAIALAASRAICCKSCGGRLVGIRGKVPWGAGKIRIAIDCSIALISGICIVLQMLGRMPCSSRVWSWALAWRMALA